MYWDEKNIFFSILDNLFLCCLKIVSQTSSDCISKLEISGNNWQRCNSSLRFKFSVRNFKHINYWVLRTGKVYCKLFSYHNLSIERFLRWWCSDVTFFLLRKGSFRYILHQKFFTTLFEKCSTKQGYWGEVNWTLDDEGF